MFNSLRRLHALGIRFRYSCKCDSPHPWFCGVYSTFRQWSGFEVRYVKLEGSSQWVLGCNITRKPITYRLNGNSISFKVENGQFDCQSMIDYVMLSYAPLEPFTGGAHTKPVVSSLSAAALTEKPWSETKSFVDKVHHHVCDHFNYADFKLLLERNGLWDDEVSYMGNLVDNCRSCSTAPPQRNRKVSISSLSKGFNENMCIEHFHRDDMPLIHCMDMVIRHSTASIVPTANMDAASNAFQSMWVTTFWYPENIYGDMAFETSQFLDYIAKRYCLPTSASPST